MRIAYDYCAFVISEVMEQFKQIRSVLFRKIIFHIIKIPLFLNANFQNVT